jgi:hypothetical protein
MEFWLSRSLLRTFLSHDGILAITEPFANFSLTRWNSGYHRAFHERSLSLLELRLSRSHSLFFHTLDFSAIKKPFTNFLFHFWNFGYHRAIHFSFTLWISRLSRSLLQTFFFTRWNFARHKTCGKSLFIYIKEYLHRIRLLKIFPLDLGPPLQGKEYGPFYSKVNAKSKIFLFPKPLIAL